MQKKFYLSNNFSLKKGAKTLVDLNEKFNQIGAKFTVENKNILVITVDDKAFDEATKKPVTGRPVKYTIDFSEIEQMKANGMTNKEIYTELGISKSLFYLKMKEYNNNIGHKNV